MSFQPRSDVEVDLQFLLINRIEKIHTPVKKDFQRQRIVAHTRIESLDRFRFLRKIIVASKHNLFRIEW